MQSVRCPFCEVLKQKGSFTWWAWEAHVQNIGYLGSRYAYCQDCQCMKSRREWICTRDAHIHGYEFPGRIPPQENSVCDLETTNSTSNRVKLKWKKPSRKELVGKYNIIFYTAPEDESMIPRILSRKTKGELTISLEGEKLGGKVEMDNSLLHYVRPDGGKFSFVETQAGAEAEVGNGTNDSIFFETRYLKEHCGINSGYLKVISGRIALPLCPDYRIRLCGDMKIPTVQFKTLDEAVRIQGSFENSVRHAWIVSRLGLPDLVAARICHFLRPAPIFFFEEGDVMLQLAWKLKLPFGYHSVPAIFVARRKH